MVGTSVSSRSISNVCWQSSKQLLAAYCLEYQFPYIVLLTSWILVSFNFVNPFVSNSLKIMYLLTSRVVEEALFKFYICAVMRMIKDI